MAVRAALLFLGLVLALPVTAQERGVTNRVEPVDPTLGRQPAAVGRPGAVPPVARPALLPLPPDTGWTLVDSLVLHRLIPAGQRLAVKFDSATESLRDTLLPEALTDSARRAVAVAPDWLKDDLRDNLRRLGPVPQNRFAALILDCPDKRYYDELCFQVAHLSSLVLSTVDAQILEDNVQQAYVIDRALQYVDIVDYGDPLRGGDYYSTTRYRVLAGNDTNWVELPRDAYYWWVVMPKLTDEQPAYVYDKFWREYLFYECDSGYPLLSEKLAPTRVFWDGRKHLWGGPITDTMPAVAVVGRWTALTMPYGASGNRPIQPNQIAHEHNGNCGEMQDLLCAAARTALLPCGGVLDINEDHVWNEIWWGGGMIPYANDPTTHIADSGVAYERKYGGSKSCSGIWDWRNDGWQRSVIATYSDVCTLAVEVRDSCLRPVDGALVKISSEDWYGGTANCFFGVTGPNGRYTTELGDLQNYYLSVECQLGGQNLGRVIDSAQAVPGSYFFSACTLSGRLDSLSIAPDSGPPLDRYRIDVSYTVGHQALYGTDCYNANGSNQYSLTSSPGEVDCFIARGPEFSQYLAGLPFQAAFADENSSAGNHSLNLFAPGDWYAVLSNEERSNITAFVDVSVRLYRRGVGVAERGQGAGPAGWVVVGPSPFRRRLELRLGADRPADAAVRILSRDGRLVRTIAVPFGPATVSWDGRDADGRTAPAGVYLCFLSGGGRTRTESVVFLGGAR